MAMVGCAGKYESVVQKDLRAEQRASSRGSASPHSEGTRTGSHADRGAKGLGLPQYFSLAMERNPETQAAFERWRASVLRISRSRRLPEPTVGFGYFVRSVETRVGPQQARFSLTQTFPWPTKLSAGADAASAQARAAQKKFEAQALMVAERVATSYWNLWQIRRVRVIHREHLEILKALSETVQARMVTGAATLAELQQINLAAARLEDDILGMDEGERASIAQLRAAIGGDRKGELPTPQDPGEPLLPRENESELARFALEHPIVATWGLEVEAAESTARAEQGERMPSFTLGADWIITGETSMAGVPDSGKDAVIVAAGMRLPLWQGSYADSISAARADARARRAEQQAASDRALAELSMSLSAVRDGARRVRSYESTLVPQAEAAYEAVLGSYTVGRGTVAETLLAQRDLLELRVELYQARADYARAWARLEEVTGREIAREGSRDAVQGG